LLKLIPGSDLARKAGTRQCSMMEGAQEQRIKDTNREARICSPPTKTGGITGENSQLKCWIEDDGRWQGESNLGTNGKGAAAPAPPSSLRCPISSHPLSLPQPATARYGGVPPSFPGSRRPRSPLRLERTSGRRHRHREGRGGTSRGEVRMAVDRRHEVRTSCCGRRRGEDGEQWR
jgi:hypothetical protein